MPSVSKYISEPVKLEPSETSPYHPPHQVSTEKNREPTADAKALLLERDKDNKKDGKIVEGIFLGESDGVNASLQSLPNGRTSDSTTDSRGKTHSRDGSIYSKVNCVGGIGEDEVPSVERKHVLSKPIAMETAASPTPIITNGILKSPENGQTPKVYHKGHARAHSASAPQSPQRHDLQPAYPNNIETSPSASQPHLASQDTSQGSKSRFSSPPVLPNANQIPTASAGTTLHPTAPRLHHRHTLEVPRLSTSRTSRDFSYPGTASEGSESGRFSPTPRTPRASNTLVRAPTRSIHSDMFLDEVPADSELAKWTENVKQKRASRRKRKEEEEDDRVVVGTKVDMNHVNWVTAYNMLTGIRFTVSRTNAKMDRDLTDADFDARHKFSFDM